METYFNYIIESGISLGIFTMIYWLLLRKEVLLKASRVYLLLAVLFSTLLPFLSIDLSSWNKPEPIVPATREIVLETNLLETITVTASGFTAKIGQAIVSIKPSVWFYTVGAMFVLFFLITGIAQLFTMISNNKRFRLKMTRLIISSKAISPYSFFNYIFISRELPEQENWKAMVHHELEHVRQGHSFDVLFVDFMMVFQWFNPFYWIIRRLVRENHEFLADRAVIQRGSISTGNYKALLLSQVIGGRPVMTSNFINVKTIQKRFKMITKNKTGKFSFLKYALGVLAALSITMCFAVSNTSSKEIEKVVVIGEISSLDAQNERNGAITDRALAKAEIEGLKGKLPEDIAEGVLIVHSESVEQKNNAVQQAQKSVKPIKDSINNDEVFQIVEDMPLFPGGEDALRKWIGENVKYPAPAAENGIHGKVYVQFVVEADGSVSRAKVVRGVDPSLDAEALRVVNASPKWKPGYQGGKAVPVSYTVPINFALDNGENGKKIDGVVVTSYKQEATSKDSIFQTCEVMPVFPGGETEVRKFIANNIRYPKEALKYGEVGKVYVTFIVAKDGAVEKVRIVRSVSPALDNEAIRVVSTMPNWIPGKNKGEPVNVQYTMPVNFQLQ
ncbi:MAG: M56 family metallopeptidase [Bacteroidales bacterium]|nr:M56 family metallopeptidase [Bacteroidales bacterium]